MKSLWIIIALTCFTSGLYSQYSQRKRDYSSNAITLGILQGGGSLIGADIEFLLAGRLGIQAGAGLVGYGGGINYHLGPSIRSSFISLQYWNQGIGDSFTQSV
ncbi:MAG: hypothetical protein IH599_00250, partial [Bacteroidales bacterium]|nr:hypothetical protein [Bacteroidales bacterium]